jgi:hypothetical protein
MSSRSGGAWWVPVAGRWGVALVAAGRLGGSDSDEITRPDAPAAPPPPCARTRLVGASATPPEPWARKTDGLDPPRDVSS